MSRWQVSICDENGWRNFSLSLPAGPFDDREDRIERLGQGVGGKSPERGLISQLRKFRGGTDPRFTGYAMIVEPIGTPR